MFRPRAQSSNSPCSFATGKMAFNATKVARAPACFTESKIPMFHRRLKTTSEKLVILHPNWILIIVCYYMYIIYVAIILYVFNYIALYSIILYYIYIYICLYIYIYIYIHIVY